MSLRVWRHPKVDDDLLDIWLYIARRNVAAADRLLETIEKRLSTLAEYPAIGPLREDIAPEIRVVPVGNYLVLYRHRQTRVDIIRVIHGSRDLREIL